MSKYIRTKDFIAISELNKDGIHYCYVHKNLQLRNLGLGFGTFQYIINNQTILNGTYYMIPSSEVIKQEDSIEELCDEFVMVNNSCFIKPQIIDFTDLDMYKGETIYGATWTDKGLIYVAKLNDKGDLELI